MSDTGRAGKKSKKSKDKSTAKKKNHNNKKRGPITNSTRLRRFRFVLNNWTPEEESDIILTCKKENLQWMFYGRETAPTTGTPHLQGACILGKQLSVNQIHKLPGFKRMSIQWMDMSAESNIAYASKEDPNPFQWGTAIEERQRTDWGKLKEALAQDKPLNQILDENDKYIEYYVKYPTGCNNLRSLGTKGRKWKTKVAWIYGPTGSGKSAVAELIAQMFAENYGFSNPEDGVYDWIGDPKWFDHYDRHPCVTFDDMRAKQWPDFSYLLKLFDRYKMTVQVKTSTTKWCPRLIVCSAPRLTEDTFEQRNMHKPEDINQLNRRIELVVHVPTYLAPLSRVELAIEACKALQQGHRSIDPKRLKEIFDPEKNDPKDEIYDNCLDKPFEEGFFDKYREKFAAMPTIDQIRQMEENDVNVDEILTSPVQDSDIQ